MEASEPTQRVDVGFQSGQTLVLRIKDSVYQELVDALRGGKDRWHEIETFDSAVTVDLGQITYLRRDTEQHRVGF